MIQILTLFLFFFALPILPVNPVFAQSQKEILFEIGKSSHQTDGKTTKMDTVPFIQGGRAYVPVRYLATAIGITEDKIIWYPMHQKVTLTKDNVTVMLSVGVKTITMNDRTSEMDVAPILQNGRIYLPARYIAQAFSYDVNWDGLSQSVRLVPPGKTLAAISLNRPMIYGSPAFIQKISEAADLMKLKAPTSWEIIETNLSAIREFDRSGADVTNRVFNIGPATAASDTYWLASTIVHDAYHVQQFLEGRVFYGEAAEAEANQKQLQALIEMEAPNYLIEHLKASMSKQYWEVEYQERNW